MRTTLRLAAVPLFDVGAGILGQNFELSPETTYTLLSDRLRNPKFFGPAHPQTGLAPEWLPKPTVTQAGMQCALRDGMSLHAGASQFIANFRPHMNSMGIQQTGIAIRTGEKLEVELWAKPWHAPVKVQVGLSGAALRSLPYVRADLNIDGGYWKPYRAVLEVPRDDDHAVFYITIYGEGMLYIDQAHLRPVGEPLLSKAVLELMASMRIPALRYPGGSKTTIYGWRHGLGPVERRPVLADPVHKSFVDYDFGTDEYLQVCHDLGITPHITVNVGTGTPDEATDWADHCASWFRQRGIEPPFAYFQVGNEQDMVHESAHMTGPMYVQALRDFVPGLRQAYPNSRIIAVGAESSPGLRKEFETPWRKLILEEAGDLVDSLSMQLYKGQVRDNPADQQLNAVESARKLTDTIQKLVDDIAASGKKITASCTEWNYWLTCGAATPQEPFAAMHAFFVAGVLNQFTRMARYFELSCFYQLFGGLGFIHRRGPQVHAMCLVELFKLYRPAYPGTLLEVQLPSPPIIGQEPMLDAIALRNKQGLWVLIANRSPVEAAEIELNGLDASRAEATLLLADDPTAQLMPREYRAGQPLPPLSMARLHWKV